jgi:NAD(P)-dependent dehydrogenase (short-subunit alcohol dehydrogenase family)
VNGDDVLSARAAILGCGSAPLAGAALDELAAATERLLACSPSAVAEYQRYLSVRRRRISTPDAQLAHRLAGATVLVTGHTGCIGSVLLRQLAAYGATKVVGVDLSSAVAPQPGVHSNQLDVRNAPALRALLREVTPDLVFHLAAQRDPGLAERAPRHTVTTNVLGTRNLVRACEEAGVSRLVLASTGKAMRPYTTSVYAASKRICERIVADATARGAVSGVAVRFTHVVDNAIVLDRLRTWCDRNEVIRLHNLDTLFYAQSALESAQLLLVAALAPFDGVSRVHAIRHLGWPVALLDLALGAISEAGTVTPIQQVGVEAGYEDAPYPGLYDPRCSGEVSPLLNALEALSVHSTASPDVDAASSTARLNAQLSEHIRRVERLAITGAPLPELRTAFDQLARADLGQTVQETPADMVRRITELTAPHRESMTAEHRWIDDVFRRRVPAGAMRAAPLVPPPPRGRRRARAGAVGSGVDPS